MGIVENLTLILHVFFVDAMYPLNLIEFFGVLLPIVAFDLIPADEPLEYMFQFSEVDDFAISETYEEFGYESIFSVVNMGSLFLTNFMLPSVYAVVLFLIKLLSTKFKRKYKEIF